MDFYFDSEKDKKLTKKEISFEPFARLHRHITYSLPEVRVYNIGAIEVILILTILI